MTEKLDPTLNFLTEFPNCFQPTYFASYQEPNPSARASAAQPETSHKVKITRIGTERRENRCKADVDYARSGEQAVLDESELLI